MMYNDDKGIDDFMAQVNIRVNDDLKHDAEMLFSQLGTNISSAFNMFLTEAVREQGMPLSLKIDPFYSEKNQERLMNSINNYESGKSKPIVKTMKELEDMANES